MKTNDLQKKIKDALAKASTDTINEFFHSEFDEEISKYDSDEAIEFKTALKDSELVVQHIDNYGGEDMGSEYWSVYSFADKSGSMYVKFNGWYQSYNGSEFEEWYFAKAVPKSGFDFVQL